MGTLGRNTRNGKKSAARRSSPPQSPHPAIAKLAVALSEHKETLEQQRATAEILRAISSSSTDPQPVFEAIVEHAHRLCGAVFSILYRYDGNVMTVVADRVNARASRMLRTLYPAAPRRDHIVGRAILDAKVIHSSDVPNDPRFPGNRNAFMKAMPFRAGLEVPLLRNGAVLGVIAVGRLEPNAFTKKEISLLQTFADQALIAMENVRLFNETREALEQQTATSEILRVISNSPTKIQPVLDAVAATAARLCEARDAIIQLREGDVLRFAAHYGTIPNLPQGGTRAISRHMVTGRAVLEGRQIHVHDLQAEEKEFPQGSAVAKEFGYHTLLVTPLMREGKAIGTILIRRAEVRPFSDKHLALARTFADQAVIAIENVRLFNETKEALEHQKASADILRVVAGSIENTDPVFEAITRAGMRLIPGSRVSLILVREGQLHYVSHSGIAEERRSELAKHFPLPLDRQTVAGTAILDKRMIHVPDFAAEGKDFPVTRKVFSKISGFRAMLAVPLVRSRKVIGAINVSRETPGPFTDKQIALANTFADQAVIAIQNANMFREIQDRNSELKQSLEFQGASGEILASISSSVTDTKPVFDAIAENTRRLLDTNVVAVSLLRKDHLELVAAAGDEAYLTQIRAAYPWQLEGDDGALASRVVRGGQVVHVCPIHADQDAPPKVKRLAKASGYDSILMVPMLRQSVAIGLIATARQQAVPFDDRQIALIRAFADQAVIAIENARLFNDTKEALERQTATSEVLRVISQSQTDAQPVFDAIIHSAVRLCAGTYGHMTRVDGDMLHLWAHHGNAPEALEMLATRYPAPLSETSLIALAVRTRSLVHSPDTLNDPRASHKTYTKALNLRAQVSVPLIKGDTVIGVLNVQRDTPGPFSEEQLELLRTFADQAVIAIENARLFNETKESLERQTATGEILRVIAGTPADAQPVFDAIAQSALRVFDVSHVGITVLEGGSIRSKATAGSTDPRGEFVIPLNRDSTAGRCMLDRTVINIGDTEADDAPSFARDSGRLVGFRAIAAAPMLREGMAIGSVHMMRREPGPFSDTQIELLKTFADQAVIAIENARLFNETREALEKQTATAEILRVISSSPTDTQPVFEAIVRNATRLCEAVYANVFRYDGELIHWQASHGWPPELLTELKNNFPMRPNPSRVAGRVVLSGRVVLLEDTRADPEYDQPLAKALRYRKILGVPLLREGRVLGALTVGWSEPGPVEQRHEDLLKTFADQAVIAIENVRLFNETKESLEQQTATAEILKVISSSPTATQPVFEAIVQSAARLFSPCNVALVMREGDLQQRKATAGPQVSQIEQERLAKIYPLPFDPDRSLAARVMLERRIIEIPDTEAPGLPEIVAPVARAVGYRSVTAVPLIREDEGIGAIGLSHPEPGFRLTEKQLSLLRTFASQAVIAIENVRLFNETQEALEQQTATAEILKVISGSPTDTEPVFQAIAERAGRICEASDARIFLVEGTQLRYVAGFGNVPSVEIGALRPMDRGLVMGRSVIDGKPVHVEDIQAVPDEFPTAMRQFGHRTVLSVPLMRENKALGAILLRRLEVHPFSEKQIALLKTFADQAAIAIENVRLFNETKESLEQQTAISEVLRVISGSPTDVKPVLEAVAARAARICDATDAQIFLADGDSMRHAAGFGDLPVTVERFALSRGSVSGRAVIDGGPVQIHDILTESEAEYALAREIAFKTGWRSALAVPLVRESRALGAIVLRRKEVRPFTEKQIALLKTFADQAAIAIENVRLFNETKEALERQTATADILKVISASPTDVQPVFSAVAERAAQLCSALHAVVLVADGDVLRVVASIGGDLPFQELPIRRTLLLGRAFLERQSVHAEDVVPLIDNEYPDTRENQRKIGYRSFLSVPMTREGKAIGVIGIWRPEVKSFSKAQIELLETFAAQAVIAIENVRLFNETRDALERQTATSEILKVISSSTSDTQPVFDAIVQSAQRLMAAKSAALLLRRGSEFFVAAYSAPGLEEMPAEVRTVPLDRDKNFPSRVILDAEVLHITDWGADDVPEHEKVVAKAFGFGSGLQVPLLREAQGIGALVVTREAKGQFHEKEMALLRSFADQAVIAIENVRLFNETKESLEQQTATAEILRVISSTQTDIQPVFDAIAKSAMRIFEGMEVAVALVDGNDFEIKATSVDHARVGVGSRLPLDHSSAGGRATLDRVVVNIADTESPETPPVTRQRGRDIGVRAFAAAPMLKEGMAIGHIAVMRQRPVALSEKQIALLRTFADQAVIAIENVRLFNETKESLDQQTATAEILKVISSSPTDTQPVFEAIARTAVRLFGTSVVLRLAKGNLMERVAELSPGDRELKKGDTAPLDEGSFSGRAIMRHEIVHVPDISAETWTSEHTKQIAVRGGYRSGVFVPMMREGEAIGAVGLLRHAPGAFDDKQIALLRTFADQAVIAIENVRLFKELEARTEALSKSVRQLTALGEVGQAISSTLDLETVLKTIVARAVQLTGLDGGSIYEYDDRTEEFRLQAAENMEQELVEAVRRTPVRKGDGAIGRTAVSLEPVQVADILDEGYRSTRKEVLVRAGYRAILAVPLLREDHMLGAILVHRRTSGSFSPEVVELLKTFATQSAMAIQNARLFREIAEKGKQLEIASRHKSDFLASMSHELRTPLNALLGFNEMILGDIYGAVPSEMKPPLAQMQSSGKHLLRLINNVLDLAKIEAGRMELSLSDYSVHDTVESVRSTLRPLAADKGLEFLAAVQEEIPLAYGDAGRITQCLMNLAGNSLKFTKAGKVEISAALNGGWLRYRVADTGIGIPSEKLGSLFTEFKQTDATIASEYGGTGLGLSISKKFVEMHGGRIWVESEVGKGSMFIFEIPLRTKTA